MPAEATSVATTTSPADSPFDREMIAAVRRRWWVVLLGPIVAAVAVYAINPDLPGTYVSTAYLRLDPATAESLSIQRKNPSLADLFFGNLPETSSKGNVARIKLLSTFMSLTEVEPSGSGDAPRLYRLEMIYKDPVVAQSINREMLVQWLKIYPSVDRSVIVAPPDLPTAKARSSRIRTAIFAGIAAVPLLLFLVTSGTLFRGRRWRKSP